MGVEAHIGKAEDRVHLNVLAASSGTSDGRSEAEGRDRAGGEGEGGGSLAQARRGGKGAAAR